MQVSGARMITYDGRKTYEMLAKCPGEIKWREIRIRSDKLNRFWKNIFNWTSWKIISIQSRRSLHCFVTSWTDTFMLCAKYWTYTILPLLCTWTMVRFLQNCCWLFCTFVALLIGFVVLLNISFWCCVYMLSYTFHAILLHEFFTHLLASLDLVKHSAPMQHFQGGRGSAPLFRFSRGLQPLSPPFPTPVCK